MWYISIRSIQRAFLQKQMINSHSSYQTLNSVHDHLINCIAYEYVLLTSYHTHSIHEQDILLFAVAQQNFPRMYDSRLLANNRIPNSRYEAAVPFAPIGM